MAEGLRIEGFAIVSSNGMIADCDCLMPNALKFDADQEFLDASLDRAALLIHGRKSHECQVNSTARKRLLLTRCVDCFSLEPCEPNVWLWNPAVVPFDSVCEALNVGEGLVAVLGGTAAYDMFLDRYAAFHLVRAGKVHLQNGTPVLSDVGRGRSPENVLASHGLTRTRVATIDPRHDLVQQLWTR